MTRNEFVRQCLAVGITPEIALENDKIREALKERNDAEVLRLLKTEF